MLASTFLGIARLLARHFEVMLRLAEGVCRCPGGAAQQEEEALPPPPPPGKERESKEERAERMRREEIRCAPSCISGSMPVCSLP